MAVNGLTLMTPSSITYSGTGSSATINSDGSVSFTDITTLNLKGVFNSSYNNYYFAMNSKMFAGSNDVVWMGGLNSAGNQLASNNHDTQTLNVDGGSIGSLRYTNVVGWFDKIRLADNYGYDNLTNGYIFNSFVGLGHKVISHNTMNRDTTYPAFQRFNGFTWDATSWFGMYLTCGPKLTGSITIYALNQ